MTKQQGQKRVGGMMPTTLVKKLEAAARRNERSFAAEMRLRLEQSFSVERAGKATARQAAPAAAQ